MKLESWDPLTSGQDVDAEILFAAKKREIKNILKSYVGMYDSFSELIQNAMDAVDRRATELEEPDYTPKLWLTINLEENSFSITDNGIGFNEKEFKAFLAPNISFKNGGQTRGNKGVGATYIGYGFDYLQFGTKVPGHTFHGELLKGRDWVEDFHGIVTRPMVTSSEIADPAFAEISRGSTFKIKFGGNSTRPKDLSWYSATTAEQWLYLLLIKTPLGAITFASESSKIKFQLKVVNKQGAISTLSEQSCSYIYPHLKLSASVNLKDVLTIQKKLQTQGKDSSDLPMKYLKANGIYEFFSTEDLLSLLSPNDKFDTLISQYQISAYGYFAYSTSIWDQFNDELAKLRKLYRVLKGGLQLANNQMIQGDLITIPLTSNIGHQNQCHVIVHFVDADPDLGRKGFQPELKEAAEQISVEIVKRFQKWRRLLRTDTGAKNDITREGSLHDWVRAQEAHEIERPLSLTNKNFFAPTNEISITSEPVSEQDVIVLFNQLVAGGVIRGIKLLATSQTQQYDGVFKFIIRDPLSNHEYDKENNPLGVQQLQYNKEYTSPPKILEYKFNIDALIREFESEYKSEKEIHLAIAWELGSECQRNYDVVSLLDLDNLHLRDYHGITHILNSATTKFYVIALKELIDYLNSVEGVQEYHRKTYSGELFD
ncbi:ATP-binding protein [Pseudomonas versuta]|uniref:ATP-binding protein n=1 Tax=Pseudomonas versuta TaxID=1788301 RepID=A0A853ZNB9_9PSED|nr:ATP-binding protein [Pseudomonas versuta]OKA18174.1 ATP-binding protein [Pseudomonas versuta]